MQLVTVSVRPPYHLRTVLTVESDPFITENIPPRTKVALTHLEQTPLAGMEYDPPPVMTVGLAHRLLPPGVAVGGTGVLVRVGVLVIGGAVGVGGGGVVGVGVRVGVLVGQAHVVLVGVDVRV